MKQEASFFNPSMQKAQHDPLVQFIELLIKIDEREKIVGISNEKAAEDEIPVDK